MHPSNTLRVLSYNIHKGFSAANQEFVLQKIKESVHGIDSDLVLLQEVHGHHEKLKSKIPNWPTTSQFEYLADQIWKHYAYGKNAVYTEGHHGNAILSKFPIIFSENEDVSQHRFEQRGVLHATVDIPGHPLPLHVFCVHLGLFSRDRKKQALRICERIRSLVPQDAPLVVGGDFNDWQEQISPIFQAQLSLQEAFVANTLTHAKTFPSWLPLLKLDRLYFRGLHLSSAQLLNGTTWRNLSDHLPILVEFELAR